MEVHQFRPSLPPPRLSVGVIGWLRSNLFSNWFNTLLTLLAIYLVWLIVPPLSLSMVRLLMTRKFGVLLVMLICAS